MKLSMVRLELLDQYMKCCRSIAIYEEKIQKDYVKGYISRKKIKNKDYYYLQWNSNGKTKSKYIKDEHIKLLQDNIKERKVYEDYIKEMKFAIKEIESFIGKDIITEYLARR